MKMRSLLICCLFICAAVVLPQLVGAQTMVEKTPLFKVPLSADSGIIGMRVSGNKVFVANSAGRFVRYDLDSKEALNGRVSADKIIDFDVALGQMIFLDGNGRIGGRVRASWPGQSYVASKIDLSNEGLLLSGGDQAIFLEKNATEPAYLPGLAMVLPVDNGFVWAVQINSKDGNWNADLYDSFGNLMHEVYKFSDVFDPSGLELGPLGTEGELLVSAIENKVRKLSLIGNNGYMFWKMDGPPKLFPRDVAFDNLGNMLVLELQDKDVWLTRWVLTHPEG
ncbi:MAG: hypothetical protein CVV41_12640 [Candidatus Riflebacteria bacterium HGW-Riflebacteria-1]|jgi:hypothetical protein|nr:MAG: hypothetical protein CVV41_12640 [Candidatus Riflebacteria bacterium HGW-Riflebacteria-1]